MHRKNPWLYERSGDLNPAWCFFGILLAVECFAVVTAFLQSSITVKIVSLSLLGVTINVLAMASVSQNKAAIIANAQSTGAIAKGLTGSVQEGQPEIEHEERI